VGIAATLADVEAIGRAWADTVNAAYAKPGSIFASITRTFERRGIEDHGPERRGHERKEPGSSNRGDINHHQPRDRAPQHAPAQAQAVLLEVSGCGRKGGG
jgi:hypothetical protein